MRKIEGCLYRVKTAYGGCLVEVSEEKSIQELIQFCAELTLKGEMITSVTRIFVTSKETPRISVLTSPEYRQALKDLQESEGKSSTRKLWARMGVTLDLTPEEEEKIFVSFDSDQKMLQTMLDEGRIHINGNTYIPGTCVEDFNKAYGTTYEEDDLDITD